MSNKKQVPAGKPAIAKASKKPQKKLSAEAAAKKEAADLRKFLYPHATD